MDRFVTDFSNVPDRLLQIAVSARVPSRSRHAGYIGLPKPGNTVHNEIYVSLKYVKKMQDADMLGIGSQFDNIDESANRPCRT